MTNKLIVLPHRISSKCPYIVLEWFRRREFIRLALIEKKMENRERKNRQRPISTPHFIVVVRAYFCLSVEESSHFNENKLNAICLVRFLFCAIQCSGAHNANKDASENVSMNRAPFRRVIKLHKHKPNNSLYRIVYFHWISVCLSGCCIKHWRWLGILHEAFKNALCWLLIESKEIF